MSFDRTCGVEAHSVYSRLRKRVQLDRSIEVSENVFVDLFLSKLFGRLFDILCFQNICDRFLGVSRSRIIGFGKLHGSEPVEIGADRQSFGF